VSFHKSETYGKILLDQKYKQHDKPLVNFAHKFARHFPFDFDEILSGLNELYFNGVIQCNENELWQKRMIRDNEISNLRAEAGSKGGKNSQFAKAKYKANEIAKGKGKSKAKHEYENEYENPVLINKDINLYIELINTKFVNFFLEEFRPKNETQLNEWANCLRKLIEIDKYSENEIGEIIFWARQDDFWSNNFLTIHKLRKKNNEGIKYIEIFKHQKNSLNGSKWKTNGLGATEGEIAEVTARKFATDRSK
jgi:hypothetical protein